MHKFAGGYTKPYTPTSVATAATGRFVRFASTIALVGGGTATAPAVGMAPVYGGAELGTSVLLMGRASAADGGIEPRASVTV